MTPKEKAKELVNKFYCKKDELGLMFCVNWSNAKKCALISVDEVLDSLKFQFPDSKYLEQWQEVKEEINKL